MHACVFHPLDSLKNYRFVVVFTFHQGKLILSRHKDRATWETSLVNTISRCTDAYERLPLVQDKELLDNILYSGVWVQYRKNGKERKNTHDR